MALQDCQKCVGQQMLSDIGFIFYQLLQELKCINEFAVLVLNIIIRTWRIAPPQDSLGNLTTVSGNMILGFQVDSKRLLFFFYCEKYNLSKFLTSGYWG